MTNVGGDGAVMGADEIHQAEVERLDGGQGGDLPGFAQRAKGFDQNVQRNRLVEIQLGGLGVDDGLRRPRVALHQAVQRMEGQGGQAEGQERRQHEQHRVVEQSARQESRHPELPLLCRMGTG